MPTYDYVCQSCEEQFEIVQSMTADPLLDCPACKSPSMRRLIGAGAGIIFKGSGFYETDYRRSSKKGESEKGESEKGESEASKTKDSSTEGGAGKETASSSLESKTSKPGSGNSHSKKAAVDS